MREQHGARIKHAVTAHFHLVPHDCAKLFASGLDNGIAHLDGHQRLVALDVACHRAGPQMRLVAQNGITDVVKMRRLHIVKQHGVLYFGGISYDSVFAHDSTAADERAVADLGVFVNDAGTRDKRGRGDAGRFGDPHILRRMIKRAFGQRRAQSQDKILDLIQHVPRILSSVEKFRCDGFAKIQQFTYSKHYFTPISRFCSFNASSMRLTCSWHNSSVGASTMTRSKGSVPLLRTKRRPVSPRAAVTSSIAF